MRCWPKIDGRSVLSFKILSEEDRNENRHESAADAGLTLPNNGITKLSANMHRMNPNIDKNMAKRNRSSKNRCLRNILRPAKASVAVIKTTENRPIWPWSEKRRRKREANPKPPCIGRRFGNGCQNIFQLHPAIPCFIGIFPQKRRCYPKLFGL